MKAYEDLAPGIYLINSEDGKYDPIHELNSKLLKKAFRHGQPWTAEEVITVAEWKGSDEDLARKLCRSLFAVQQRKSMIRFCRQFSTKGKSNDNAGNLT